MTEERQRLVRAVRERINAYVFSEPPAEMCVTSEEFEACEEAVRENLKERDLPPLPFTRSGKGIVFKNVEIYIGNVNR